jgi:hypothetical protein
MKVVLQAIIGSIVIYVVVMMLVGYIGTFLNFQFLIHPTLLILLHF